MLSQLVERHEELPGIWTIRFTKPAGFNYTPGDYTELELDYPPNGGRRWFSLSSAPREKHLSITFRLPDPHSRFKQHLMRLKPGDKLQIAPPMGNFNLPLSPAKTLFVAVGIGATPFRSMVLELTRKDQLKNWDIKLLNTTRPEEILFSDVFSRLKTNWIKSGAGVKLSPAMIENHVPDFKQRLIFLAGPEVVADKLHSDLAQIMPKSQLKLSYFPGYKKA